MIKTDARIDAVVNCVGKGDRVAEIGTDHGKIALGAAYRSGNPVIATDISEASLEKARRLFTEAGAEGDFRAGDGLAVLKPGEADVVIIAGMGGLEIIRILSADIAGFKKYILMPHRNDRDVRDFLIARGLAVVRDELVKSGRKYYRLFVAERGVPVAYTSFERVYGKPCKELDGYLFERKAKLCALALKARGPRKKEIDEELEIIRNGNG